VLIELNDKDAEAMQIVVPCELKAPKNNEQPHTMQILIRYIICYILRHMAK